MKIHHFKGTHREVGRQHGEALAGKTCEGQFQTVKL